MCRNEFDFMTVIICDDYNDEVLTTLHSKCTDARGALAYINIVGIDLFDFSAIRSIVWKQ